MPPRPESPDAATHLFPLIGGFAGDLLRASGRRGVLGIAAMLLGAALESAGLVLLIPLLALAIGQSSRQPMLDQLLRGLFAQIGIVRQSGQLMVMLLIFAALFVLRAWVVAVRDVLMTRATIDFVDAQRKNVVRAAASARWDVIARLRQARVTQVLGADVQNVATAARLLQFSIVAIATLLGQCFAAVILSPRLAILCLVVIAVGTTMLASTLRQAHSLGRTMVEGNLSAMNTLSQFFGGLKLAVSQDLQTSYVDEVAGALDGIARHQLQYARDQARRQVIIGTAAALAGIAVAAAGLLWFYVPPAVLVGLLLILVRMSGPATALRQYGQQLVQILPAHRSLTSLHAELVAAPASNVAQNGEHHDFRGAVAFRAVSFAHATHDASAKVLDACSMTIAPGEFVGLTGLSGAGKTTLVDLLVGLYQPQAGGITIDGVPLDGAAVHAWRRRISYISQDPYLFHDSVRHNLLWARPDADEDALWAALRLAGAEAIVRRMPGGLDATVGERGTLISGGERQRLAIARAMIRHPRLLILDEATNAIDIAAERQVIDNLLGLDPRPSILMIAHRNESLARCDRILSLEDGRIVELDVGATPALG